MPGTLRVFLFSGSIRKLKENKISSCVLTLVEYVIIHLISFKLLKLPADGASCAASSFRC
jgi:hypothetical protein